MSGIAIFFLVLFILIGIILLFTVPHFGIVVLMCCLVYYCTLDECDMHPEYGYCMENAASSGRFGDVYRGLKRGGDAFKKVRNKSLLELAIDNNHTPSVRFLIDKGLEIKANMYLAADKVSESILNLLLKTKKNMDVALIYAARENRKGLIEKLLNNGAKIDFQDKFGDTAFMISIDKGFLLQTETIFNHKPALNIRNKKGETALIKAVKQSWDMTCEKMLSSGAKPNIADNKGWTPLFYATEKNNMNIVRLLVKKGANVKQKDKKGELPVMNATDLKIVKYLKKAGSPIPEELSDRIVNKNPDLFKNEEYLEFFYSD